MSRRLWKDGKSLTGSKTIIQNYQTHHPFSRQVPHPSPIVFALTSASLRRLPLSYLLHLPNPLAVACSRFLTPADAFPVHPKGLKLLLGFCEGGGGGERKTSCRNWVGDAQKLYTQCRLTHLSRSTGPVKRSCRPFASLLPPLAPAIASVAVPPRRLSRAF